jgi:hypothetical protein
MNISLNPKCTPFPLLLPPFHTSGKKKKKTSTPLPLNNKKKIKKINFCTLSTSPIAQ